jgi:DNA-binding NtrC family response regulator
LTKSSAWRVLILDDEPLISALIADSVVEAGHHVAGVFLRVSHATEFIAKHGDRIDLAILDVNVAGERSAPLIDLLTKHDIATLLVTGYGGGLEPVLRTLPILKKPFSPDDVATKIDEVMKAAKLAGPNRKRAG